MARSVEEDVEEHYKKQLDECGVKHCAKTDAPNESIRKALDSAPSKRGGQGRNYPDIQCLVELPGRRFLPVMIEAKGARGKLVKTASDGGGVELAEPYEKDGPISKKTGQPSHRKGDLNWAAVTGWAVNGAVWYADAILDGTDYTECLAIGVNGWEEHGQLQTESSAWYVSAKNNKVPKKLEGVSDLSFLKEKNLPRLAETLDKLLLSQEERDRLARQAEETLEKRVKAIHQRLYDSDDLKTVLSTNEKLYLFCGLIMAGLPIKGQAPLQPEDLRGNGSDTRNDGTLLLDQIQEFLRQKGHPEERVERIAGLLKPVFARRELWKAPNGESLLKNLYQQVSKEIIPCFKPGIRLDFTGRILNSLNDWVQIENDKANDVVLTPRAVTRLMTRLAQVDRNSLVWDAAAGSGGFLVSALDAMERDAEAHISDADELEAKKDSIHKKQLLGVEILGNMYVLAVLNMILMGDGSSRILNANTFDTDTRDFPATVFLLNPPYSHPGKGLDFVARAVEQMTDGCACVLIQENAGSGQDDGYAARILKQATLRASIHMPADLFRGKSSVQTAIYLFQTGRPHKEDDLVTFIDFSVDGYTRSNRRKSTQAVNLRDTDHARERYEEVVARVLGKKPATEYYTKENGLLRSDIIGLKGGDWTYSQHRKIDIRPTEEDLKRTVADYLAWRVSQVIKGNAA